MVTMVVAAVACMSAVGFVTGVVLAFMPMTIVAVVPRVVLMVLVILMPRVMVVVVVLRSVVVAGVGTAVVVGGAVGVVHIGLASPVQFNPCWRWSALAGQFRGSISLSMTHLWLVIVMPSAS